MAGVQHLQHHVQLPAVVVLLRGEVFGFILAGPMDAQDPVVDVGAGALAQMGSLQGHTRGLLSFQPIPIVFLLFQLHSLSQPSPLVPNSSSGVLLLQAPLCSPLLLPMAPQLSKHPGYRQHPMGWGAGCSGARQGQDLGELRLADLVEAELGEVEELLRALLRLPGDEQVRDLCRREGRGCCRCSGNPGMLPSRWGSSPCTSCFGWAASLHREALVAGLEGAALEHIQELPQGGEFPLPAFQHKGIAFLLDAELPVLEAASHAGSLATPGAGCALQLPNSQKALPERSIPDSRECRVLPALGPV